MSRSNERICQLCYLVCWVSAFWDEVRRLRLAVLTSVLSYVWWVPLDIFLSHRSVLTMLHLSDMPRCTLTLLMHLWKCEDSGLNIHFPMLAPLLPRCFWVETASLWWRVITCQAGRTMLSQTIGQFNELFLLELLAQFHDRQWDCLCPHPSLVERLKDDCGSASKNFTTSVDLPVSGICYFTSFSLVILFVNLNPPLTRMSLTFW